MHICCSNCSLYPLKTLFSKGIDVKGLWLNPNIHPYTEYHMRLESVQKLQKVWNLDIEYIDVLRRVGIRDEYELEELLSLFSRGFNILFTTKTPKIKITKNDLGDDKLIGCAVALKADAVITGDREVLAIKKYMSIKILTPQQFLKEYRG